MTHSRSASEPVRHERSLSLLGILTFLLTMLSMATIGLLVPLGSEISRQMGLTRAEFGAALSLFSLPSAILSLAVGSICDKIGARTLLIVGGVLAITTDLLMAATGSAGMFRLAVLATGMGFAALVVGSPALIIGNLVGRQRTTALSLWSTYAPIGVAVGFLIAAPFAGTSAWRTALYVHMALLAVATVSAAWLMRHVRPVGARRASLADIVSVVRHGPVLRLGIALAIPSGLSYGTSLIAPSYITSVAQVSMASAATMVALGKIVVAMVGGLFAGWLMSREMGARRLFTILSVVGIVGQAVLFYPHSGLALNLAGLGVWLFAYAGIAALVFASLPLVFDRVDDMGAANGLISQCTSLFSFLAPIVYFRDVAWTFYPVICTAGVIAALLLFPGARRGAAPGVPAALRS